MFTRQHYEAIAEALRDYRRARIAADIFDTDDYLAGIDDSAKALAVFFEWDNPRFDRGRFLRACRPARIE